MTDHVYGAIVIGEGISGLTVAKALAEAGLGVATFESQMYGGLIVNINDMRPGPSDAPMSGSELTAGLMEENAELGVASIQEPVTQIVRTQDLLEVHTSSGVYAAHHVVMASGARLKKLGVPGESEFAGRGVSQCADCDGPMNFDADVVVVGGGDSALQEALVLTRFGKRIHLVHRGDKFRAREEFVKAVSEHPKITVAWNTNVVAITGKKVVDGVRLAQGDVQTRQLACTAVFAYVGLEPNEGYVPDDIARDASGYIVTDSACATAWPNVWAVGALRSGFSGLVPDAIEEGKAVAERIKSASAAG
jgi:thioredoxin reductase (NADPH)